jgi:hypothetical protein
MVLPMVASAQPQVAQWQAGEISLTSARTYNNPFLDVAITAAFIGPDGVTIHRPGFWYEGNVWKIRFAPPRIGTWSYSTTCSDISNSALHGQTGVVECIPYTGDLNIYKHGFLRVSDSKRYLVHADATPFFYLGDTHWFMEFEAFNEQFVPMVQKRLQQKFTVYQSHPVGSTLSNSGATSVDPAKYKELDRYFKYIADNGLVHAFGLSAHSTIDYFTPQGSERVAKYVCARYGAYPVLFFTSQEIDLYGNQDKWKHAFDAWNAADDYHHPATCHLWASTAGEPTYWADDPQHDLFFLQGGHGTVQDMAHYKAYWDYNHPTKPFVEAENNYEEIRLGSGSNHADMVRKAAYKSIQCGSLGYGYGANGIWNICWTADDCACCEQWGMDIWSAAINFPAGQQMQYLYEFYTSLKWWELYPRFKDENWASFYDTEKAVIKTAGSDVYVVYFYGDDQTTGRLKNLKPGIGYTAVWFNPETDCYQVIDEGLVSNDGQWAIPAKPNGADWLLWVMDQTASAAYHRISVAAGSGGQIYPSGEVFVADHKEKEFRFQPDFGYALQEVLIDGHSVGAVSQWRFPSVTENHTVEARFSSLGLYKIETYAGGGGRIIPSGPIIVSKGETKSFRFIANTGFVVRDVLVDGVSMGPLLEYTFTQMDGGHTLSVVFSGEKARGLLGEWRLDEMINETTPDYSGTADGLIFGGASKESGGVVNDCFSFDGADDYIQIGNTRLYEGMSALTLSCWIKMSAYPAENCAPVGKEDSYRFIIGKTGAGHFVVKTTQNGWYTTGTVVNFQGITFLPGIWYHLAGTYDGEYIRCYANGKLAGAGSARLAGAIGSSSSAIRFGSGNTSNVNYFNGKIDEVKIYDWSLSEKEVQELYMFYRNASAVDRRIEPMTTPDQMQLLQNYPNPFNAGTHISYYLPEPGRIIITVYDRIGHKICTLVDEKQSAGLHRAVWDGRSDRNALVPSGIYFYQMVAPGLPSACVNMNKMVFIK